MALLVAMAIPVPMTTLSPFEIAPRNAFVVAAPIEGVIAEVLVDPGAAVSKGQPLLKLADTELRNRFAVAEREVLVAQARLKKASQLAFDDVRGRHDLRIAMEERALKTAERDFARDMLMRATVRSKRSGIALFADRQMLVGKPVTLGEKIMSISDPKQVEVAIDVAVSDVVALKRGASVSLFFASGPLHPRQAKVEYADYRARARDGKPMTYRVIASLSKSRLPTPRLGVRGTAKLHGKTVPLVFYLFRRPLAALRQWFGL